MSSEILPLASKLDSSHSKSSLGPRRKSSKMDVWNFWSSEDGQTERRPLPVVIRKEGSGENWLKLPEEERGGGHGHGHAGQLFPCFASFPSPLKKCGI